MLNILVGAVIGAAVNTAAYCAIQLWRGKPIETNRLLGAVAGGLVAGALAGTTLGASLLGGTSTAALEFLAIDGGAAASAEKMTENALEGKALGDGVGEAAAWGAISAPVTGLVLRGVSAEFAKLAREAALVRAADAALTEAVVPTTTAGKAAAKVGEAMKLSGAPGLHALGTMIGNAMFGSPWVGEAVKRAKTIKDSKPTPVSPSGEVEERPEETGTTTSDTTAAPLPSPSRTSGVTRALETAAPRNP